MVTRINKGKNTPGQPSTVAVVYSKPMIESSDVSPVSGGRELNSSDSICEAITSAVATAEGCSMVELDPLYEAVDVDALAGLFASGPDTDTTVVQFSYHGYELVVTDDGGDVTVTLDGPLRSGEKE